MKVPNIKIEKREGSKNWRIRYRHNGKDIRKTIGTKRQAELAANAIRKKFIEENFGFKENELLSFKELYTQSLNSRHNIVDKTRQRYKNYYQSFERFMEPNFPKAFADISKIKRHHIEDFITYLKDEEKENKSNKTVNSTIEFINSVFKYAVEDLELIRKSPCRGVRKFPEPKKLEFYSEDELNIIWDNVDPFFLNFYKILYYCGLRVGELIYLTWDDVNLNSTPKIITIKSTFEHRTKTDNIKVVPLHDEAEEIIEAQVGKNSRYVFVDKKGNRISENVPLKRLKIALNKVGIKGDLHKLRHSFASHLVMSGESIYKVSKLLGHKKIETTLIYSHLAPSSLKDSIDKLPTFNKDK